MRVCRTRQLSLTRTQGSRDLLLLNVKLLDHLSEGLVRKVEKLRTAAMLSRGQVLFCPLAVLIFFDWQISNTLAVNCSGA